MQDGGIKLTWFHHFKSTHALSVNRRGGRVQLKLSIHWMRVGTPVNFQLLTTRYRRGWFSHIIKQYENRMGGQTLRR
jgi:hypothetical protein